MENKLLQFIIEGIQEKKGEEIVDIHLSELDNSICDHFLVCHGDSHVQVHAIADAIEKNVREKLNDRPTHREGMENARWIILDYHTVMVHIFQQELREHYNLEELWNDTKIEKINSIV